VRDVSSGGGGGDDDDDDDDDEDCYRVTGCADVLVWQIYRYVGEFPVLKMEALSSCETREVVRVKARQAYGGAEV
jgi:hypothetical protein